MKIFEAIGSLDPSFQPMVVKFVGQLFDNQIRFKFTAARRTIEEQNRLYRQGRTDPGPKVTNAKGGQSPHNFGCAIDVVPVDDHGNLLWKASKETWNEIGRIGKECGLIWGGDFKSIVDRPHFEAPHWKTIQAAWKKGEIQVA